MIHAVVMAGGAGTRFWPESRSAQPKQLLNLAGQRTMIQATIDRLGTIASSVMVVTNQQLVQAMREQLPQLPAEAIIGEPCKRDTAPCVGLAAIWLMKQDPNAIMVVMPADHVITTDDQFQAAMRAATQVVEADTEQIVTFGIRPTYPAESFGYIERDQPYESEGKGVKAFRVKQFREKPTADVAKSYLAAGNFYWNSGIFVWQAAHIVEQLRQHEPEMMTHLDRIGETIGTPEFEATFVREFEAIRSKSIDYAVMERAAKVTVIEAPFTWDDVGSWQSLSRLHPQDSNGNTIVAKHLGLDSEGCIIRGPEDHLIVTIGLKDCIVVHTENATLVASKDREESVRDIVKRIQEKGWSEYL